MNELPKYINPWLQASLHPRNTIRFIVENNPKQGFVWIAWIYALQYLLFTIGYSFSGASWTPLIVSLVLAPVLGLLWFYFYGWLLSFTGKWLGGQASMEHLRAAFAWSKIPSLINYPIWLFLVISSGSMFFLPGPLFTFLNLIVMAVSIWMLVLLVAMVAEVQKFSLGRAIINCFFAVLLFTVIVLVLMFISSLFGFY